LAPIFFSRTATSLQLYEDRARAFHAADHGRPGNPERALHEEDFRWIADLFEAGLFHFKDADLIGRAEAIFDGPEYAEAVAALALEIEHGVDHVLENARTRDRAVLRHMTDQKRREPGLLRPHDDRSGTFPDLGNTAGRRRYRGAENRLDRVHDQHPRLELFDVIHDALERGFAEHEQIRRGDAEPFGAHFDLSGRLFTGNV
jgi:hypothetical protein